MQSGNGDTVSTVLEIRWRKWGPTSVIYLHMLSRWKLKTSTWYLVYIYTHMCCWFTLLNKWGSTLIYSVSFKMCNLSIHCSIFQTKHSIDQWWVFSTPDELWTIWSNKNQVDLLWFYTTARTTMAWLLFQINMNFDLNIASSK